MTHNAFDVYLNGNHVDTVFDQETDPEEVRRSLINHDGYNPDIEVEPVHTPKAEG